MAADVQTEAPVETPARSAVKRGADALAAFAGVWRVAVFGSVARGGADPSSDIDYLVVCAEIDYQTRNNLALEMQSDAAAAAGHAVDVVLTDTAEWLARTACPSTFEAHIEAEAVNVVCGEQPAFTPSRKQTITMASAVFCGYS